MAPWLLLASHAPGAETPEPLPVLTGIGPWPVISRLIGYDGKLWFVNSVIGRNYNSADVYSYAPDSGVVRYEKHLFSQYAGQPVVARGLLYWPFEDPRFTLGWAEFMATDGHTWRYYAVPGAKAYHLHALAGDDEALIAATSAWPATLQISGDGGLSWAPFYGHPTAPGHVSRILTLPVLDGRLFGFLRDRSFDPPRRRLLVFDGQTMADVPGWPRERGRLGMATFEGWLYGAVPEPDGVAIWRTNGEASHRVTEPRLGWRVRDLTAAADGLWAVTSEPEGGTVWHSADGASWTARFTLEHGTPRDIVVYGGNPYVGGSGIDGRGILWGAAPPAAVEAAATPRPFPTYRGIAPDWAADGALVDRLLADADSYDDHAAQLRHALYVAVLLDPPPGWLDQRMNAPMSQTDLSLVGGRLVLPASTIGRWAVLWAMALAGDGEIPNALLAQPWTVAANAPEKYFDPLPAALWALNTAGGPNDQAVAALIARLARTDDPPWLTGDVVGALSALTGLQYAYDTQAWQRWWQDRAE